MPWANLDANFEIKAPCQISTVSDAEASEGGVQLLCGVVFLQIYKEIHYTIPTDAGSVTMAEGDNKSANMLVSINQTIAANLKGSVLKGVFATVKLA